MAQKCAFCTNPADSREHIFSDWMGKMMPPGELLRIRERNVITGEYAIYKKRKLDLKSKTVCTKCNNGWMSDMENDIAKPALGHLFFNETPTTLDQKDLTGIAIFGFKTLVIANHLHLKTTPFFTYSARASFRRDLIVPNGVQVWMATRKTLPGKYYGFWQSLKGTSDQPSRYGFTNYVCTWNFQNIVLQILGFKWKDKRRRKTITPSALIQNEQWNDAAIQIWPLDRRQLQWPLPAYLGDDMVIRFRDRFEESSVSFPSGLV